jgi:hypothetical protein
MTRYLQECRVSVVRKIDEVEEAREAGEAGEAEEVDEVEERDGKHPALRPRVLRSLLRFVGSILKLFLSTPKLYFAEVGHQLQTVVVVVKKVASDMSG